MTAGTVVAIVFVTACVCVAATAWVIVWRLGKSGDHAISQGAEVLKPIPKGLEKIAEAIAERISETKRLEAEILSLTNEIQRLRADRLAPSAIKPFLDLGFEVPYEGHHYLPQTLRLKPSSATSQKEILEYRGLYEIGFVRKVGVELKDLRFELKPNNCIAVAGIAPKTLGLKNVYQAKKFAELHRYRSEGTIRSDEAVIVLHGDPDFALLEPEREKHEAEILKTINLGSIGLSGLPIDEIVMPFLHLFFHGKYRIMKDEALDDAKSLFEICELINASSDAEIARKEDDLIQKRETLSLTLKKIQEQVSNKKVG